MENNYTIVPPKGMRTVINGNVITFEEIKEEVKESPLPRSWEELKVIKGYYVDDNSRIKPCSFPLSPSYKDRNIWPSKEEAEASLALAQLCQLRDKYNDGWKPDWSSHAYKYSIIVYANNLSKSTSTHVPRILSFKTIGLRDAFMAASEILKLLETAKPLL